MLNWFRNYNSEITWWIIGWLSFATVDCIIRENYLWACIDAGLIYINYKLWKNR